MITFPDGHQEEIKNLRGFCRDKGLNHPPLYDQCNGKRTTPYKGYQALRLTSYYIPPKND